MRRSGFTMVELIFVIIIIGILSAAAIPKFGDIKDRSKINSEYAALSSLDGAIVGAIEFQQEDYDNMAVLWHDEAATAASTAAGYKTINDSKDVLGKIIKKGDSIKVVAFADLDKAATSTDSLTTYDILFLEGTASSSANGVKKKVDVANKPDKNDFWVFNTSAVDINITGVANKYVTTTVESGELKLIDSNETVTYGGLAFVASDSSVTLGTLTATVPSP